MSRVIAVDFDGCICEEAWPHIGRPNIPLIEKLREKKRQGCKLILWTCREGELLKRAVAFCKRHGIEFDAVNENLPERIEKYGDDPRKISADEYWDDRAVWVEYGYEQEQI